MKKILGLLVLLTGILFSCSDDDSDMDFGKEMYIENIKVFAESSTKGQEPTGPMFDVNFKINDLNILTGVDYKQGEGEKEEMNFDENGLQKELEGLLKQLVTDEDAVKEGENTIIKGYEFFNVVSSDSKGNVTEFTTGEGDNLQTIKLEYGTKPFFLYWNLKAAGIFNVLKGLQYFGNADSAKAEMVDALIPVNNISKFTLTNKDGYELVMELTYTYDADGMLTGIDVEGTETDVDNGVKDTEEGSYRVEVTCKK